MKFTLKIRAAMRDGAGGAALVLGTSQRDAIAFGASSLGMVAFVETVKALAARGVFSSLAARKLMHIGCGPLFVLTWPLFSERGASAASCVPLAMSLKFAATGLGLLRNDAEVRAMSRTGAPRELLRGPLLYGLAFVALTRLCWRSAPGVAGMMALCFGDGMAEVVGRRYGAARRARLPWSPRKSWIGSAAFLVSAAASGLASVGLFHQLGWVEAPPAALLAPLLLAVLAGCIVESLPLNDADNVLVPLVVAAVLARLQPDAALQR
mgnify:CR=1 FL=1